MKNILDSLLYLLYPELCLVCGNSLIEGETVICGHCENSLPRTRFHDDSDNLVSQLFWGRVNLKAATSFLFFRRKGIVQQLMHQFKYKGEREVGRYLGKIFAQELADSANYSDVDCIVPVPLHPDKQRKRGYNQSEDIARGMAEVFQIPCKSNLIQRAVYTSSQTKKSRFNRWENVSSVFVVPEPESVHYENILIVDDVVTTGATLEACAQKLLESTNSQVSIATLAVAYN